MAHIDTDIILFGGGIAGLWTLNRLLQQGYSAVLLESGGLGGVQTIASQGIIHGGTKYALTGALSDATKLIGAMPGRWRDCLQGRGELDLRMVKVNAEHQFLWSTESLASKLTGFFAGKVMQSRMHAVKPTEGPELFHSPSFKGTLYRLDEPVLDVPGLAATLVELAKGRCYRLDELGWEPLGQAGGIRLADGDEIHARAIVLSAGAGNESLLQRFGRSQPLMQRRPLHMLMVRGQLPPLYAHCLGVGANPRLTITTHLDSQGRVVWNIGGHPAESGIGRDLEHQVAVGREELTSVLPWVDFTATEWSAYRVDRAEAQQPGGKRPDGCFVQQEDGIVTVWPTKLAFAPMLADQVIAALQDAKILPSTDSPMELPLPQAPMAEPPWENAEQWI